jgi:hypothetical protein
MMTTPRIAIPIPHSASRVCRRALPQYEEAVRLAGEPVRELDQTRVRVMKQIDDATQCFCPATAPMSITEIRCRPARENRTPISSAIPWMSYSCRMPTTCKPVLATAGLQILNVPLGTAVQHIESAINHSAGPRSRGRIQSKSSPAPAGAHRVSTKNQEVQNSSHHQSADVVGTACGGRPPPLDAIEALEGTLPGHLCWQCSGTRRGR